MATLYIAEYAKRSANGEPVATGGVVREPPLSEQTVAIGGTSAQSAAFNAATKLIRVHTDAACSILVGANPVATAAKKRLAAGQTEYFAVTPGHKLAVIQNT